MKKLSKNILCMAVAGVAMSQISTVSAGSVAQALKTGKAYGDFRLRYESVEQDNALDDASALTLRTRLGYVTGSIDGFSATIEAEDSRVVAGVDDYNDTNGKNAGEYSVVADPKSTELDQAFLQYKTANTVTKLGRQVITMDNHRFVGHVGWRQDRQTFDALSTTYTPSKELKVQYAYLGQRNRIFAEAKDITSKDHLINASYKLGVGTVTGYGYLLEEDTAAETTIDTFGLRFNGSAKVSDTKILYGAEFATQEFESGAAEYEADYMMLEGGAVISGVTAKLTYEVLGSDDSNYGFATPLATLHKFNGWSDQFLATPTTGLVDLSVSVSSKIAGGKLTVAYHDFSADEETATVDDLGSELNISYAKKFGKIYNAGIKYAAYDAGDIKVDADKLWVWVGASF